MQKFQCFANILYPNILDLYIKGTEGATSDKMVLPKFIGRISNIPSSSEKDRFQCSLLTPKYMLSTIPNSSVSVANVTDYLEHLQQLDTAGGIMTLEFLLDQQDYIHFKNFHVIGCRRAKSDGSVAEKAYVDFISGRPHLCHIISNSSRISRSDIHKLVDSPGYMVEFLERYDSIYQFKVIETLTGNVDDKLTLLLGNLVK